MKPFGLKQFRSFWIVIGLFVLGVTVRTLGLTSTGIWLDEGYSYFFGQLSWKDLLHLARTTEYAPPLWFTVQKATAWIAATALSGMQPWMVRLPPYVASLMSMPLVYLWMRCEGGERAGKWALLFLTLSPAAVFYAQEGRSYGVMSTLYLLAVISLRRFQQTQNRLPLVNLVLSVVSLFYLHDIAIIYWLTLHILFFIGDPRSTNMSLRRWWAAQIVIFLTLLPWIPNLLAHAESIRGQMQFVKAWEGLHWFWAPIQSLRNLVPGDFAPQSKVPLPHLKELSFVMSVGALMIVGLGRLWRQQVRFFLFLGTAILLPLFCLAGYSEWFSPAFHMGRSEIVVLPVFCALLGISLASIGKRWLRWALASLIVLGSILANLTFHFADDYPRKKWDHWVAHRVMEQKPGLVILHYGCRVSIAAYLHAQAEKLTVMVFPDDRPFVENALQSRYFPLHMRADSSPEVQRKAKRNLEDYLETKTPETLVIVTPVEVKEERGFFPSEIAGLLGFLKATYGYEETGPSQAFPMDWQAYGFHEIFFMQRSLKSASPEAHVPSEIQR